MPGTTEAIAFTDSYKHMECLCGMILPSFLTKGILLCLPVQRRVPQLVYTNKIGDCLFIYLFVYLFIYLFGYGKPNRKAKQAEIWRIDVKSPDDECGLGAVGLKHHLR